MKIDRTPSLYNVENDNNSKKKESELKTTQIEYEPKWFKAYLSFLRKTSDFVEARWNRGLDFNDTNYSEIEYATLRGLSQKILKILPIHPDLNLKTATQFHQHLIKVLIPEYHIKVEQELGTQFDLNLVNLSPDYEPLGSQNKKVLEIFVIVKDALNTIILFQESREVPVPKVAVAITRLKYLGFTDRFFIPSTPFKEDNILNQAQNEKI